MKKTEQLIEQNNQLRTQLTKENEAYYDDLLVYIRVKGFLYDELLVESTLLQILQDILEAQTAGQTAAEYFGNHPQETALALLDEFPKPAYTSLFKWAAYIFGLSSFYTVLSQFSSPVNQLRIGNFLLNGLLTGLLILLVFFFLQKSIYQQVIKRKFLLYLFLSLLVGGLFTGIVCIQVFLPTFLAISVSNSFMIGLILFLLLAFTLYLFKNWQTQREILQAILPFVYLSGIHGCLIRLFAFKLFFISQVGKIIFVVLLLGSILWFYYQLVRSSRKIVTEETH